MWGRIPFVVALAPFFMGMTLVERLNSMQPRQFSCRPAQPDGIGDICVSTDAAAFLYPQKIAILVPKGLERPNDISMHIHGWRGVCESANLGPEQFARNYRLFEQMVSGGGGNSVMVLPMSSGKNGTHGNYLGPRFTKFSNWMEELVQPRARSWAITGHSGAFWPIRQILASKQETVQKIRAVGLIDATYSRSTPASLERAQRLNPSLRIYSTYIRRSGTHAVSAQIANSERLNYKHVKTSSGRGHCEAARRDLADFTRWQRPYSPIPKTEIPVSRIPASVDDVSTREATIP